MSGPIETERMLLVPATPALLAADLDSPAALASIIGAALPDDWPAPFHTDKLVEYMQDKLAQPGSEGWWLHYYVSREGEEPLLVGNGGFKGPPDAEGSIEIGYALVPSAQGRGFATEAASGLIAAGFVRGASVVRAETFPDRTESIRVMERAGMTPARSSRAGVVGYEIRPGERPDDLLSGSQD